MNLTDEQRYCLQAMGIDLWQLRQVTRPVDEAPQDPSLKAQIDSAWLYCLKHVNGEYDLITNSQCDEPAWVEGGVELPPYALIFSNPKLKKKLWQVMTQQK